MTSERIRKAYHAGSWYSDSKEELNSQLDAWLAAVTPPISYIGPHSEGGSESQLPVPGARVLIAPHAGYAYSGPAAAWAYKCWDISKAKRIFLLGPSHHYYLSKKAALTRCTSYATPIGDMSIDRETTNKLYSSGKFEWMSQSVDEEEHSLEMHLPYIYKMLTRTFPPPSSSSSSTLPPPPLIPILIGHTSPATERGLGNLLREYVADPSNVFVISSDFAHWGIRFGYTYYRRSPHDSRATAGAAEVQLRNAPATLVGGRAIAESIREVDFECIGACESGRYEEWLEALRETGNTVCGRHPIGVMMAAMEEVRKERGDGEQEGGEWGLFKFVRYERSSEVRKITESSVSYASAFAVL